jgi:hypothetical protein
MLLHKLGMELDRLVQLARQGDLEAAAQLHRRLGPHISRLVARALHTETASSLTAQAVRGLADDLRAQGVTNRDQLIRETANGLSGLMFSPRHRSPVAAHPAAETLVD